jgi:glycosyltransferase involved in cell wall biosynthesis
VRPTTSTVRIGLDLSPAAGHASPGVARAALQLCAALERRGRVEVVRLPPPPGRGVRRWRHHDLARIASAARLDALHSFTSAVPLWAPCRRVQTVHELPWLHGEGENAGLRHRLWARLGARVADLVVTMTETVAAELREHCRPARLAVVPWGVAPGVERDAALVEALGLRARGYVLVPGGARPKKLASAALAALDGRAAPALSRLEVAVTGVGPVGATPPRARLRALGVVDERSMEALVQHAACVAVPSLSEGWSLPVLEALVRGVPVVVPAGSAQAEVAGEGGVVAASRAPDELGRALAQAVEERDDPARVAARLAVAARRDWDESARRMEEAWLSLA